MNNPEEATPPRNEEAVAFKYPLLNIIAATKPAMIVNTHTPVESKAYARIEVTTAVMGL